MKKDDKKRLKGRPWQSKMHFKNQINDKQSDNEPCIAKEDDKKSIDNSVKILGKRAQLEPLNFEIKDGGPAKIQK